MIKHTLALGTPVTFHHRAAVSRYRTKYGSGRWELLEGTIKNEALEPFLFIQDMFADNPKQVVRKQTINKTVMVWPQEGSGIIIAMVKRGKGISVSPSGGGGWDGDWDTGYFEALEYFELYAVKSSMQGTDYMLCPMWAVKPIIL